MLNFSTSLARDASVSRSHRHALCPLSRGKIARREENTRVYPRQFRNLEIRVRSELKMSYGAEADDSHFAPFISFMENSRLTDFNYRIKCNNSTIVTGLRRNFRCKIQSMFDPFINKARDTYGICVTDPLFI